MLIRTEKMKGGNVFMEKGKIVTLDQLSRLADKDEKKNGALPIPQPCLSTCWGTMM
ncbi:hypothetical protein [Schleiferilactobacillus harbinensis]|nr:hypothetical protein [Schleiferilactobacillus harbinensis]